MSDSEVAGIPQPGRIRVARDLRQLTQAEAVARMTRPITAAGLSQIEAGKVRPALETLADLAEALEVPVGFFRSQWPDSGAGDVLSHVVYFRDLAATPAKQRRRAAALALLVSDLLAALELRVRMPDVEIPIYPVKFGVKRDEIEDIAQAVRGEWSLGDGPIAHVVREIERRGVPITRLSLGTRHVDAFSVRFARRPIILLTNDKSNYVRSRFDAAHELGHLILHADSDSSDRAIERQAQDFSASLLLPAKVAEEVLPRRIDAAGWSRLAQLKREWGVSIAALLYRSRELRVITPDSYTTAIKYMSAKGWRTAEPGDRQMGAPEAPTMLERALRAVEVTFNLTEDAVIHSAHLPLDDARDLIHAAIDSRPRIEI